MDWLMTIRDGAAVWLSLEVGRATVLLLAAGLAAAGMRRASAARRHLLWCAALVSVLALPVVSALMPWRWSPLAVPITGSVAGEEQGSAYGAVGGRTAAQRFDPVQAERPAVGAAAESATIPGAPTAVERALGFATSHWLTFLLGLWALGAALSLGRLLVGGVVLRATVRRAQWLDDPAWRRPLYEAADRLDLRQTPRLVLSDRMPMPFVTGVLRPTIVLPAAASEWSSERRRAVLLHELAHVRRRDLLLNTMAHVACGLWWFHPLVRIAARRLRAESERACDDLVLRLGMRPSSYADDLLQIVRDAGHAAAPSVALPLAQRREFEGRMLAILEADARRDPLRRRHTLLAVLAFGLLVLPLAGVGPVSVEAGETVGVPTTSENGGPDDFGPVNGGGDPAVEADADAEADADTDADHVHDVAGPAIGGVEAEPERIEEVHARTDATAADQGAGAPMRVPSPWRAGRNDEVDGAPLAAQDTVVVAALRAALRDPSGEVRAEAAWALGSMNATSAGPDLVALLGSDVSPEVRRMAVWSIVQLGHAAGVDAIADAAQSDDDAQVREMAVWALGQLEDPATLPTLVAALSDEDVDVRSIAGWAIGTLQPSDAPAALISALEDEDGEVREHAAWALGRIGDGGAIPALTRVIADDVAGEAALWAIGSIGGEAARPALMEALRSGNDEVRAAAARALAGRSNHAWPWPWPRPIHRD